MVYTEDNIHTVVCFNPFSRQFQTNLVIFVCRLFIVSSVMSQRYRSMSRKSYDTYHEC